MLWSLQKQINYYRRNNLPVPRQLYDVYNTEQNKYRKERRKRLGLVIGCKKRKRDGSTCA